MCRAIAPADNWPSPFIKCKELGRRKESQVVRDSRLRYGQVIERRVKGRLVAVSRRVIFGVKELIPLNLISTRS